MILKTHPKGDKMKKLFTILTVSLALCLTQASFAHHHTRYFDTQNHNDQSHSEIYHQTFTHNGGYTGAKTQAEGGFAAQSRGGFLAEDDAKFTSILKAKKLGDNSYVRMKGKIVSKISKEKYLFKDNTGTIQIEIDDDTWKGIKASPKDTVIIEGEVDKDWDAISIDVDTIELAK